MRLFGLPLNGLGDSREYTFCRWLAVPLFGGLYRCRTSGTQHLPRTGGVIVVTNHKANIDPVIAGMVCDRPLRYMAKKELFGNAAFRKLIVSLGAFPIDRGAGDREALTRSLEILADGGVRDGRPHLPVLRTKMGPPVGFGDLTARNSKTYHEAARRMQAAVAGLYAQL